MKTKIHIVISTLFILFFIFLTAYAFIDSVRQSNEYYEQKKLMYEAQGYSSDYCFKYYSQYTTKNVPVGCLKHFN